MSQVRLGELLVRAGVLSESQLESALQEQHRTGADLGRVLIDHRMVDEAVLYDALANVSGMPRVTMSSVAPDDESARQIQQSWAQTHGVAPLSIDAAQHQLNGAVSDPTNVGPLDELSFRTGYRVVAHLATDLEVSRLQTYQYGGGTLDRGVVPPVAPRREATRPPSAAISEEMVIMHDMNEMRDALHGTKSVPPPGHRSQPATEPAPLPLDALSPVEPTEEQSLVERLGELLEQTQAASMELQALFEVCVARGLVDRSEYLTRLQQTRD